MVQRGLPRGSQTPQKSRRKPVRRSRSNRFGLIAITLALPLIAFAVWYLYDRLSGPRSESVPVVAETSPDAGRRDKLLPVETLLVRSGIEKARIRKRGDRLVAETIENPAVIAGKLRAVAPDATIRHQRGVITVERSSSREVIEIRKLRLADSGAGLVEASRSSDDAPPEPLATTGGSRPRVVLILDDIGYRQDLLPRAAALGVAVTFAIIPEAPHSTAAASFLSARGFETMCHLPMEPLGYPKTSPGRNAVLTSMTNEQIRTMTLQNLRQVPGVVGVNNHMGSRATADSRVMQQVLDVVRPTGMFFIDSKTSSGSVGAELAQRAGIRTASRDVFLDDDPSESAITAQIRRLRSIAEKKGIAVGIGHLYPSTIRVLEREVPAMKRAGITFLKASEVVR